MSGNVDNLILDLLEWLGAGPRPYLEVLDAWRTSCPRLPVWEESRARALVVLEHVPGEGQFVSVSAAGSALLRSSRRGAGVPA
jgi:D-3-phosphoglycerate dehydrogenase